ncbi:MAG: pre-peptidase C-terminal domain-containing protein, partial [Burkholderiales bacterium]|nr:pre-peptidase C-terminal domain-containing protein [Burkholderiales bacterium]
EFLMNRVSTDTYFDAYLYLRDANKNEITRDDDSGGSLNSKISYTARSDGVYYLDATSYQQHSVGQFTVVSHQVM